MGYSISQEQHERLERNRRDGRLCWVNTGRGGCFNRATVRLTTESWPYESDRVEGKAPEIGTAVVCKRHATGWDEGTNYRVIAKEAF